MHTSADSSISATPAAFYADGNSGLSIRMCNLDDVGFRNGPLLYINLHFDLAEEHFNHGISLDYGMLEKYD